MSTKVYVWKITFSQDGEGFESLRLPGAAQSLDEASLSLPGGAYTTLRTFGGERVLHFTDHLDRLEQTAALAGHALNLPRGMLRGALRQALRLATGEQPGVVDWRVRLTLDLEVQVGMLYISIQPLEALPEQAYRQGVRAVTCSLQRRLPEAKLTRFIARAGSVRQNLPAEVNEALMYDAQGFVLEGLSSNFFAVRRGVLYTAGEGVLAGITRALAIQAAARAQIAVQLEPVSLADLPGLDEAFITSASRGVLPLRQIDQAQIGADCPGPLTQLVMQAFQALIEEQLEPIMIWTRK